MAGTLLGRIDWRRQDDKDGHRDYTVKWLVASLYADGPAVAMATAGLPAIGATWVFGNDNDPWAFCRPNWKATPVSSDQAVQGYWVIEQPFSSKPINRCQSTSIEDPLNEPDRISGTFTKYTQEAIADKDGNAIKTSSHEQIRGAQVERDMNRPNVTIERNVAANPLGTFAPMVDTLNDNTLWGLGARKVKLSNVSWSRQLYGVCNYYYVVSYEFDIDFNTFDRTLLDEGSKVLCKGGDKTNPKHFAQYKDINNENARLILDGNGEAWDGTGSPGTVDVKFYTESNFLTLGIPATL
jgi:hypothetical protein